MTGATAVDDGSNDGTWQWLAEQKDVLALRQANLGKGWAVNAGLAHSDGKYIRFLDSDDWLLPDANDHQLLVALESNADLVVAGYVTYDEKGEELRCESWEDSDDFIAKQLGEGSYSHYSAFIFRKEFIKDVPHRAEYGRLDDRMFILEVALKEPSLAVCRTLTLAHCVHSRERMQRSAGLEGPLGDHQKVVLYRRVISRLADHEKLTARRRRAAVSQLWPSIHSLARVSVTDALTLRTWLYQLDGEYQPSKGVVAVLYRFLGLRCAEAVFALRRTLLKIPRGLFGGWK